MSILVGSFQTLLLVLMASGFSKVRSPDDAARAMLSAQLIPGPLNRRFKLSRVSARALGLSEIALGVCGFVFLTNLTLLAGVAVGVGTIFIGFNLFIGRLKSIDPGASCGCFGAGSAPPGPLHTAFNFAAVAIALATALVVITADQASAPVGDPVASWTLIIPYVSLLAIASALFLRGPALVAELQSAAARSGHKQTQTFTIDSSAFKSRGLRASRRRQ